MEVNPYAAPKFSVDPEVAAMGVDSLRLPTLAKALAIIAICLGSFNILGGFCGVIGMSAVAFVFQTTAFQKQMERDESAAGADLRREMAQIQSSLPVLMVQLALTVLVSIFLVIGGIGALKQREWGRKSLVYGCVSYVLVTLATWVYSVSSTLTGIEAMDSTQRAATIGGLVLGIIFGLIFLAYYIFTAYYFSIASTLAYFQKNPS
jgi:heme/copper-type cytochrome/quinol oxidase subunit 3